VWRDRRPDNFAVLAVVAFCAGIQAWFVFKTSPTFDYQSAPFQLLPGLTVLARRLLVWPVLGDHLALSLPDAAIGIGGGMALLLLVVWALRPHPLRGNRSVVVAALGLILLASVFRTRPDTWAGDNLYYSDRYFYIPRVLVAWLLIWEFNAVPRLVGRIARVACVSAVIMHLGGYRIPAPPDLRWADHCEPIRKGIPGEIPILPDPWMLEYRGRPGPDISPSPRE
jgi:hypothetical protein